MPIIYHSYSHSYIISPQVTSMKLTLPTDQKKQIPATKETFEHYWIVLVCIKVTVILKFYHFSCTNLKSTPLLRSIPASFFKLATPLWDKQSFWNLKRCLTVALSSIMQGYVTLILTMISMITLRSGKEDFFPVFHSVFLVSFCLYVIECFY